MRKRVQEQMEITQTEQEFTKKRNHESVFKKKREGKA